MKYQRMINLLDDTTNQLSKFWIRNCVEINDESQGDYNDDENNNNDNNHDNIKSKTSTIGSCLCAYSDPYILVKRPIAVPNTAVAGAAVNNADKKVIFKNCAALISCITKINNTQVDCAQDIDIVMPMCNLIEYSNAYSKTSGSLWQYYRDEPAMDANCKIIDFLANKNNSNSFKFKHQIITKKTGNDGTKDVEIIVPLKYTSNFWRIREMLLIHSESTLLLTYSKKVFKQLIL